MKSKINMTSKIFLLALCAFLSTLSQCFSQKTHTSTSYISDDNGWQTIKITDDNGDLEIKYIGDITFTDDETAIKTISANGSLTYKKDGTTIKVTPDAGGQVFYEVNGGERKTTLRKEESELLSLAIQTMIGYGIGAKERVERIYKKAGSKGVLNEVNKMKTDYVKSIYLDYLLATNSLTADEMTSIANNVKETIGSDYEKGKLLSKFSEKYLSNTVTLAAYLGAIKAIGSDYEKAKAIKIILKQPLVADRFTDVLQITNSISSDYEKAGVLKQVLENNKISATQFSEVLRATASIHSDYDKGNVLKALLNNKLPEAQFDLALATAAGIKSDYEKANILKVLATTEVGSETQWISLINAAEKISASYEKKNLLISIAGRMKMTDNVKEAYTKAAKTISSDYEYGQAMRALK
ncbi:MAG: hypothetical protein JWN76_2095 [Chitinophagaceae bacterium]|nr:hypothetical protein [Chitinophagaceae bacterium]